MEKYTATEENKIIQTILNRKSVRQFLDKPIENEKVEIIIRAGMSAPSARNRQPWKFFAVDDKKLLSELADGLPYAKMLNEAPLGIIVCGDIRDKEDSTAQTFWVQDCAAAVENILIAVEALGLGAVWTACYPKKERVEVPQKVLDMPEGIIPLCVIPVGYPAVETPVKDKWNKDNFILNKWKN